MPPLRNNQCFAQGEINKDIQEQLRGDICKDEKQELKVKGKEVNRQKNGNMIKFTSGSNHK